MTFWKSNKWFSCITYRLVRLNINVKFIMQNVCMAEMNMIYINMGQTATNTKLDKLSFYVTWMRGWCGSSSGWRLTNTNDVLKRHWIWAIVPMMLMHNLLTFNLLCQNVTFGWNKYEVISRIIWPQYYHYSQ